MLSEPSVIWMMSILGLCVMMLFDPDAKKVSKALLAVAAFWVTLPTVNWFMKLESLWLPWKYDYFLYRIDVSLGLSAFVIARYFTEWQRTLLLGVYSSLVMAMLSWYVLNLLRRDGRPGRLLFAYLIMLFSGPLLYVIVPGRGPQYAFGAVFPAGNPDVPLTLVKLGGWPNAMPSLHTATALLFVLFAGRNKVVRGIAWFYLAGTIAATLAFEHYVIDLIVAVPFACFVVRAAEGRFRAASCFLAAVLVWLLAIRFATPELLDHPYVLRALAAATVILPAAAMTSFRIPGFPDPAPPAAVDSTTLTAQSAKP